MQIKSRIYVVKLCQYQQLTRLTLAHKFGPSGIRVWKESSHVRVWKFSTRLAFSNRNFAAEHIYMYERTNFILVDSSSSLWIFYFCYMLQLSAATQRLQVIGLLLNLRTRRHRMKFLPTPSLLTSHTFALSINVYQLFRCLVNHSLY